ncbi:metallophosphoesterase [Aminobacter anthyllidis]|uniref:metallophosphoesterase n=1 Tax=Aminobacter anthyllidis TaxID=1035067 RepID=UPI002458C4DA|nr:metallophosphoesterase [Aminobacter anthyllidis]MDH4987371.1 metallophosphoesterase [Aminobacter anthyllidis]
MWLTKTWICPASASSTFLRGLRLVSFLNFRSQRQPTKRGRIEIDLSDTVVYAIGDVHGCYHELASLEGKIVADADTLPGRKLIIMLGDYIDRGPDSARVLGHLIAPRQPDSDAFACWAITRPRRSTISTARSRWNGGLPRAPVPPCFPLVSMPSA